MRAGAALIDLVILQIANAVVSALLILFSLPGGMGVTLFAYEGSLLITILLPGVYFLLLTGLQGQTLGKMLLRIKVVDEAGRAPGLKKALLRETLGKFVSTIAMGVGFLWVVWDKEKQGWHDKIARTHVILARKL
ncbi:MAG: RDD family protein [Dehalococcoidia bacterium]|nr:RDD family protein [Dehalococcoidia bacterium]